MHPWGEDLSETAATMSIIPGGWSCMVCGCNGFHRLCSSRAGPNNLRYLNISSTSLEVSGTLAGLNILLDEAWLGQVIGTS